MENWIFGTFKERKRNAINIRQPPLCEVVSNKSQINHEILIIMLGINRILSNLKTAFHFTTASLVSWGFLVVTRRELLAASKVAVAVFTLKRFTDVNFFNAESMNALKDCSSVLGHLNTMLQKRKEGGSSDWWWRFCSFANLSLCRRYNAGEQIPVGRDIYLQEKSVNIAEGLANTENMQHGTDTIKSPGMYSVSWEWEIVKIKWRPALRRAVSLRSTPEIVRNVYFCNQIAAIFGRCNVDKKFTIATKSTSGRLTACLSISISESPMYLILI